MAFTEDQIRDFLWDHRDDWADFIDPAHGLDQAVFNDDLSDLTPETVAHNLIKRRLAQIDEDVRSLRLIGKNVTLHRINDNAVYCDLIGRVPDETGIVIIELKRPDANTERESFTELLAYSGRLGGVFPMMCRGDAIFVLIASLGNRIVREAVLQSLLFDKRPVYALIPTIANDDLSTLRLRPWIPDLADVRPLTRSVFQPKHFSIEKVVWQDEPGYWPREQLDRITALAAQLMEAEGIHGFVYCATENPRVSNYPHAMVVGGLNPFEVAHHIHCLRQPGVNAATIPSAIGTEVAFHDLVPGMEPHKNVEEFNLLRVFARNWPSHLIRLRQEIFRHAMLRVNNPQPMKERVTVNWAEYHEILHEEAAYDYGQVLPTGAVRELYWGVTQVDYSKMIAGNLPEHDQHPDPYRYSCEALVDYGKFRRFIQRMVAE